LPTNVFGTHVDHARKSKVGTSRRACHTVLSGSGLGDHSGLLHPQSQQGLSKRIVDLVRTGVIEILSLEPNLCSTEQTAKSLGMVQRRWPSNEPVQEFVELGLKVWILPRFLILKYQFIQCPS
jgi:hypothetical protein